MNAMKTTASNITFVKILLLLAKQSPEEKLRLAFSLNELVKKIQEAGDTHEHTKNRRRAGTAA